MPDNAGKQYKLLVHKADVDVAELERISHRPFIERILAEGITLYDDRCCLFCRRYAAVHDKSA